MTDTIKQTDPVAWVVRIKKTHEFCDPTELYGDTAEEVVEKSLAWNSEYSEPEQLYSADQVRELQLKAIKATINRCLNTIVYDKAYTQSNLLAINPQTILENLNEQ